MAKRKKIPLTTQRKLFVLSGNQCAMPDCTQPLYEGDYYLGEIAHVYPVGGKGAPRFDPAVTEDFIDSYKNLLVVCKICHSKVDYHPTQYSAEDLFAIKKAHEANFVGLPVTEQLKRVADAAFMRRDERIAELMCENKRLNEQVEQLRSDQQRQASERVSTIVVDEGERYKPINQSTSVKDLRNNGLYRAIQTLLQNDKNEHWGELSNEDRYSLQRDLALTLFDLSEYESAAPLLLELMNLPGDHKGAEAFASIGYYLLRDYANAKKLALMSIKKFPDDPNGYICLSKLDSHLPEAERETVEVPETLRNNPVILVAEANQLEELGHFDKAYAIYERINIDAIDNAVLKHDLIGYKATASMQSIRFPETLLKGGRDVQEMALVDQALSLFETAIAYFSGTDLLGSRFYLFINQGVAKKLKGLHGEAMYSFARAFELRGTFTTFKYTLVHSPYEQWDDLLKKGYSLNLPDEDLINLTTIDAERLVNLGRYEEAQVKLEEVQGRVQRTKSEQQFFYLLLGDLYVNLSEDQKLENLIAYMQTQSKLSFPLVVVQARQAARLKDTDAFNGMRDRLYKQAEHVDHVWARGVAYQIFRSTGDWELAAQVLQPVCTPSAYTTYTRDFIESLYLAGRYRKAADWINGYIENGQEDDLLVDILSQILEFNGNREAAIEVIEQFLKKKSTLYLRAKLAFLYSLSNQYSQCREILINLGDVSIFNGKTKHMLAAANVLCGLEQAGLDIGYELAHMADYKRQYLQFIGCYCSKLPEYPPPDKVRINSYVLLRNEKEERQYIVVKEERYQHEVSATSQVAAELIGCRKDEQVMIDQEPFVVVDIQTKYAFAFANCLKDLQSDNIEAEEVFIAADPDPNYSAANKRQEANRLVRKDYEDGMFLELIAYKHNIETAAFWLEQLTTNNLRPLAITPAETDNEFNVDKPVLFDLYAILTLYQTGKWDQIVESLTKKRYVPRRVLRDLESLIHWLNIRKLWKNHVQIIAHSGGLQSMTVDVQTMENQIAFFEELKNKIRHQFEIVDPPFPEDKHALVARRVEMGTTNVEIQEFLEEKEVQLVTEDWSLRKIVRDVHRGNAVAVQQVTLALSEHKRIPTKIASAVFLSLINHGYIYVYVSWPVILMAAVADEGDIGGHVWNVIASFLSQMSIPMRAEYIARGLQEVFNLTEYSDDKLTSIARRIITFYLCCENTYHTRVLLSNQIEIIRGVPVKVREAILGHITVDLFEKPAESSQPLQENAV